MNYNNIVDHTYEKVFEDATVHACTLVIKKGIPSDNSEILYNNDYLINLERFDNNVWSFHEQKFEDLKKKIYQKSLILKNIPNLNFFRGITTGYNKAFIIDKEAKNLLLSQESDIEEIIKPLARGKDIKRWKVIDNDLFLIFTRRGITIDKYPIIKEYLSQFKINLTPKNEGQKIGRKPGDYQWYEIQDSTEYYNEFEKPKIIWAEISPEPSFLIDNNNLFLLNTSYMITSSSKEYELGYLLILLNSNLLFWVFKQISPQIEGKRFRYVKQYVEQLPIYPANKDEQNHFVYLAKNILKLNQKLQKEVDGFKHLFQKEFQVEKLSQKLEKYYELSEDEFFEELRKKKVNTKIRKNRESLEIEFNNSLAVIKPLLQEIQLTDNKIDQMVYDLYGLTDEEIQIIEENLN